MPPDAGNETCTVVGSTTHQRNQCPNCRGGEISFGKLSPDFDGPNISLKGTCDDCGCVWIETYEYRVSTITAYRMVKAMEKQA